MGFTVTHCNGTKDVDFEDYTRLLHWKGVDLTHLQRTPEPGTNRRWLYVWQNKNDALGFAEELKKLMGDEAWEVVSVNGTPSEGPLGPIEIRVGQQRTGWWFSLHYFSQSMLQKLFPGSCRMDKIFIGIDRNQDSQITHKEFVALTEQVVVILTGLSLNKIKRTFGGYRVYDRAGKKEMVAPEPVQA